MTNEEFSNEFDILVNASFINNPLGINPTPRGFNEYEKSMFLTAAQESLVKSLYDGTIKGDAFEKTEELRRYLDGLVKSTVLTPVSGNPVTLQGGTSYVYVLPPDVWFIAYEEVVSHDPQLGCPEELSVLDVVPVTHDELHKIIRNPFRGPNKKRVLRLDGGNAERIYGTKIELISKFTLDEYFIRYISRPDPIILIDLPDGLTINESSKATDCKLNSALHRLILEMAVSFAIKSRMGASK